MTKTELKKRIAEVLGVSATQSEIAFEIFFENLSRAITEGITLKIPRIGYFQLKQDDKNNNQIIYAALPEDYSANAKNLFLTFDLYQKNKNSFEIDSQVFSIGVGKPLLPLVKDDSDFDVESSFEILKKSIEERTKELLSESDQIPNYNIWDDFVSSENIPEDEINLSEFSIPQSDIINKPSTEEKFLESLLSKQDFEIENDFNEDELNVNYTLPEVEKVELDIPINHDLSIDDLLDDNFSPNNTEVGSSQKSDEHETANQEFNENEFEQKSTNDLSFAEELQNQLKELETDKDEILNEVKHTEEAQNSSNQTDNSENFLDQNNYDLSELIKVEEIDDEKTNIEDEDTYSQKDDATSFENIHQDSSGSEELKSLLEDDITTKNESDKIDIVPPASAKEFIVDEIKINDTSFNKIEDDALKEIINIQLNSLNEEPIKKDVNVLANLLREEQVTENKNDLQITKDETELDIEDGVPIVQNIEWNWGDELKEEFGIGKNEVEEMNRLNNYAFDIEKIESPKSDKFEIDDTELINPPSIELKKTRVDLFTKLEETLEKEINFLRDEIDDTTKESYHENPLDEEIHFEKPEVKEPEIELKDENVILDFKTPPPQFEFIEEKHEEELNGLPTQNKNEEPILIPPKRITIILSPEEQENLNEKKTITKTVSEDDVAEVEIIQQTKPKRNYWKFISISLSAFVVISVASIIYLTQFNKQNSSLQNKSNEITKSIVNENSQKLSATQNEQQLKSISDWPIDEYSDFPISATPPKPIQKGNEIKIDQLIPKTNVTEQIQKQMPINVKESTQKSSSGKNFTSMEQKQTVQNKSIKNNSSTEIRLSNMIFYDGKSYNFQTSSWKNKSLAEAEVNRLRSIGFNAFLVEAYLPQKGGTWYRVRIGSFSSEQEALEFMKKNNF